MKYVSIDIETTGLNPEDCQVLEIAAIIDDTLDPKSFEEMPKFQSLIKHDLYCGEPYALSMNSKILEELAKKGIYYGKSEAGISVGNVLLTTLISIRFSNWLRENGMDISKVVAAGKNFAGFDKQFLIRLPKWNSFVGFHHRSIDPAMFYMRDDDQQVPSTEECMRRAGISGIVPHRALEDAWIVIQLIRNHFNPINSISIKN
jgi:oligoribonuclease (3'-5' exoribonuclease)